MIIWKCCWNTRDFIPNLLVDLDEHLLPWQAVWLSSNQCWNLRSVSARSSNKLMGWCWKQMFYLSTCVPCENEKNTPTTSKLQVVDGWTGTYDHWSTCHGWTGNGSSFEVLFPRFGSFFFLRVRDPDGGGWMVKWKKLLSTSKKNTFLQWHHKTPKIPLGRFQLLPEFWDVFFDFVEETDQQNRKKSIAIDTMPIIQVKGLVQLQADPTSIANNPTTQVRRTQGRFIFLI